MTAVEIAGKLLVVELTIFFVFLLVRNTKSEHTVFSQQIVVKIIESNSFLSMKSSSVISIFTKIIKKNIT